EAFEGAGVNFVDAAGNCRLELGKQYVARIQGRRAPAVQASDRGLRAASYRVLLALLIHPELLGAPVRAIAEAAGVSPQTANAVRAYLDEKQLVLRDGRRYRWLPGGLSGATRLWVSD